MNVPCPTPIPLEQAVAWLLGELTAPEAERVEEHLFACPTCTRDASFLERLGRDVARLFREGRLSVAVSSALLEQAVADGMRLREYRMEPGEAVLCTAAPADDAVVVRLGVKTGRDETVDIEADVAILDAGKSFFQVTQDVVVDRARGEVAYLFPGAFVRGLPRSRWNLRTRVHGGERRRVGTYTMTHTPWDLLSQEERDQA